MADGRMSMSWMLPNEFSALKETLHAQQELLQKLHNELEAEREASATAASEALSVIHRLQEEKAAVKMEAEQYQRLAEEKMFHAEESFAVIEDLILARDMEVADLEYQLECYKCKLMSMGAMDPGDGELTFPEHLMPINENDAKIGRLGRRNSEPVMLKCNKGETEDLVLKTQEKQTVQETNDLMTSFDSDKKTGTSSHEDGNSYADQIKELNNRVQEILGGNNADLLLNETRFSLPKLRFGNRNEPDESATLGKIEQTEHPVNLVNSDLRTIDHPCTPGVLDVFEVPQVHQDCWSNESPSTSSKGQKKTAFQACENHESKNVDPVKPYAKDEKDWLKKKSCKPSDICPNCAGVRPTQCATESASSLDHINQIPAQCEAGGRAESSNRQEELKLLKEIEARLNLLQEELRNQKVKKSQKGHDPALPLPEAMLHFWL